MVGVEVTQTGKVFRLLNIYNPPSSFSLVDELKAWMTTVYSRQQPVIISMDANLHHGHWNPPGTRKTEPEARILLSTLSCSGFWMVSPKHVPTFYSSKGRGSTIDLVWANFLGSKLVRSALVSCHNFGSDHQAIHVQLSVGKPTPTYHWRQPFWSELDGPKQEQITAKLRTMAAEAHTDPTVQVERLTSFLIQLMVIKPNNIIRDFILNSRADSTAKFADSAQLGLAAEKVNVAMALKPENIYLPFEYGVGAARDLECRLLDMSKEDAINSVKSLISSYDSDPEARVIFSDGSFHPEKGGAGTAVCPGRNVFSSFALGGNTLVSNHESEAAGVLAGLGLANVLSSGTDVRRILRLVDNQGVIRRVNDPTAPKPGQGLFAEIDRALATLPEHLQVTLAWCPGHRDILGNEMADQLAKESLESSSAQRGLIAARPKGACQPPHALPRVPHAVLTPTNGACTAGTPVRPGSRKPLESRGLCEPLGTLIRVPSGTLIRVPVGTLIRIPVGTLIRVPSGTLIRVPSGTLIRVPVGTLIRVPLGGVPTGTLIRVPTGTLIRVPLGTLIRVPLGTLIRVPLGTLIRVPRGSRKPLDSRGLREPGRTGVPAVHACPEGVQGLHALRTGVHGQHACLAGLHAASHHLRSGGRAHALRACRYQAPRTTPGHSEQLQEGPQEGDDRLIRPAA
ncbi:hypothetical protein PCANC_16923 [Puccinia coronata f. sp. avenae]|uniref:RNase H type-1 domain-containing protein n=1 Tax=Puccinia coronata f. sp. avenae TaxID=200324 RepID=A0A2N5SNR4_9BASI|nr:hypothetical protein PCANC_16923 [Puccinia coronata f. sp. avenae]